MDNWPLEGFREVGKLYLDSSSGSKSDEEEREEMQRLQKDELVKQALKMYFDVERGIKEYAKETDHHCYLTPCTFMHLIQTYKHIFKLRLEHYDALKLKYKAGLD